MKSLIVDDDLLAYAARIQTFSSLLESCSPTLQSIDVSSQSCSSSFINVLAEFVYPKLEHLKITVEYFNKVEMKRLISQIPNLRSVNLCLNCRFEWPEDIVYEKMEKLKILVWRSDIDLSLTLRPLIGKVPNLKHLIINVAESRCTLSAQEITQLLTSTPYLEELDLNLAKTTGTICLEFKANMTTWRLPKLIDLDIELKCPNVSSILHHFPASFPRLKSFYSCSEIDDQAIMALSQLKHLQELGIDDMTKAQIIDLIINVPPLATLEIDKISDVRSPEALIEFLTSTATVCRRDLEIRLHDMYIAGSELELDDVEDVLEGIKNNGGPAVSYGEREEENVEILWINSIQYKSLAG